MVTYMPDGILGDRHMYVPFRHTACGIFNVIPVDFTQNDEVYAKVKRVLQPGTFTLTRHLKY